MTDSRNSRVPAVLTLKGMGERAGWALLPAPSPLGPDSLAPRARLLLLEATAINIEQRVIFLGRRLAELEKLGTQTDGHSDAPVQVSPGFCRPRADRLGWASLVAELQDACFAILMPAEYGRLARSLKRSLAEDARHLALLTTTLQGLLQGDGIAWALQGRIKGLYSLYRKMIRKGRHLESIRDRAGLRILVRSIDDCYRALGLVHTHFAYVPGTFQDYIGAPKKNGYRSLHTCVSAVEGLTAEIQIRTLQMHLEAEYGRAAHWRYKQWDWPGLSRHAGAAALAFPAAP